MEFARQEDVLDMTVTECEPAERLGRSTGVPAGLNGVIGEEGAFIMRPPHLLHVDCPDGL